MVLDEKSGSINITFYMNDAQKKKGVFYMYLSNDKIFKLQEPMTRIKQPAYISISFIQRLAIFRLSQ